MENYVYNSKCKHRTGVRKTNEKEGIKMKYEVRKCDEMGHDYREERN